MAIRPVTVSLRQTYPSGSKHCACVNSGVVMAAADVEMCVGSSFSSFEELETKISYSLSEGIAYQREKFVQLVKRDIRTLEMARKRVPKRVEGSNRALVYYAIHYTCAFGGKSYKNEGTGQRRNQR